ncbi:hypothetical protein MASR2M29_02630 [Spirochaetota bacterium]
MSQDVLVQGYAEICKEFKPFYENLKESITGTESQNLVTSCAIAYSPLIYQPEFLFIGWNPNGWLSENLEPLDEFEYISMEDCNDSGNSLSRQTREMFKKTKYFSQFSKAMKTNIFYYGTRSTSDFQHITTILNEHGINPYAFAFNWTQRLVHLIQPKVIFCEGKMVHNILAKCYGVDFVWNGKTGHGELPGGIKVLSYARCRSIIQNTNEVVEAINKLQL